MSKPNLKCRCGWSTSSYKAWRQHQCSAPLPPLSPGAQKVFGALGAILGGGRGFAEPGPMLTQADARMMHHMMARSRRRAEFNPILIDEAVKLVDEKPSASVVTKGITDELAEKLRGEGYDIQLIDHPEHGRIAVVRKSARSSP